MSEDWRNELVTKGDAIDALGDMVMNWTDSDYELGQLNQWKADRKSIIDLPSAQPEEDCNTCKHGYFGDTCCNNCRVRFTSHYERRQDGQYRKN